MTRPTRPSPTGVDPARRRGARAGASRLTLVLALLLLGACSSTTFLYNRLDIILPWYLGGYVELERDQRAYLDELLDPFLAWHRQEELSAYVGILDEISASLEREITADDVAAISLQFEAAWFRLEGRGMDWLLALGGRLSNDQMAAFIDTLWEKQAEYEEKYLSRSDEAYRREAYEGLRDSLQDYMGRLNAGQREGLARASERMIRSDRVWLEERRRWLALFEAVLLQREPGWQQALRDTVSSRDEFVSREYRDVYGNNLTVIHAAIAEGLNSRSEKQDRRLRRELAALKEDLQTLIEQGRDQAPPPAAWSNKDRSRTAPLSALVAILA